MSVEGKHTPLPWRGPAALLREQQAVWAAKLKIARRTAAISKATMGEGGEG